MSGMYRKNKILFNCFIFPALFFYTCVLIIPMVFGTVPYSLLNWNLMSGKKSFVGLGNYIKLLSDKDFWTAFGFNLKVGIFRVVGSNILAFVLAYYLNKNIRAKGIIRSLFFIPYVMSAVLIAYVWVFIFSQVLPNVAELLSWEWLANISWFGNVNMATLTIIIVAIWQQVGFLMMIYTAGLQTIPKELIEAGELDGCKGWKMIRNIQLPLLMPSITINLFVSLATAFKTYDIPNALTGGGPYGATTPLAMDIYQEAFSNYNTGYGAAKSVVLFIVVVAITLLQLHFTRKREVEL